MSTGDPRPFQTQLTEVVLSRIRAKETATVGWIETGSGKTRAWQMAANAAALSGDIDYVVVYTPRVNLCEQADLDWQEFQAELTHPILKRIGHVPNRDPLRTPDLSGFISTYQSAVSAPSHHLSQARRDNGRFLLILDEAQFCGLDDQGSGTKAGELMRELAALSRHTVLITGTPYRADREPLLLCQYTDPDEDGYKHLIYHVRATLTEGIALGYLRPPEFKLIDGTIKPRVGADFILSEDGEQLLPILEHPDVWEPIVDATVESLREYRKQDIRYRGLIACTRREHAKEVFEYLSRRHPDLPAAIAISSDKEVAHRALRDFRDNERHAILVTVRMAFIGYDKKAISVIGLLTHYRSDGHLRQLIGRGLRMWPGGPPLDEQYCTIVCPDDRIMGKFVKRVKAETVLGIKERGWGPPPPPPGSGTPLEIDGAEMDRSRIDGFPGEVNNSDEVQRIEEVRRAVGISAPTAKLAEFISQFAMPSQSRPTHPPFGNGSNGSRTLKEDLAFWSKKNEDIARRIATDRINRNGFQFTDFQDVVRRVKRDAHERDHLGFKLQTIADLKRRNATLEMLQ